MSAGLPPPLAALLSPAAYPHAVAAVELVETHVSWILLTGELAYKIKRPVQYAFIDLRSRARRAFLCREELRLNRRFAPDLYLDICPVTADGGEARIGGPGAIIEHAVRMRQFSRDEELDRLLARDEVAPAELAVFGRELARIHAKIPPVDDSAPYGSARYVQRTLLENVQQCIDAAERIGSGERAASLASRMRGQLDTLMPSIDLRRARGRVREGHGDLHARNIVRYGSRLVAFDCMEFEPGFRCTDVAEEIAFLYVDLVVRGGAAHAAAFLNAYLAESGDFHACRMVRLYAAHRALVRAKVAALEAEGAAVEPKRNAALREHHGYLEAAGAMLEPGGAKLILMSGLSGAGKTWLAERLTARLGGVHVRSDVERKRMAGLTEQARSGSALGQGLYTADMNERLYRRLAECAGDALAGGFVTFVDATFGRRADRAALMAVAHAMQLPVVMVRCEAPLAVLEARVAERMRAGVDASEADRSVLQWQRAHFEPIAPDEGLTVLVADTAADGVEARVAASLMRG